MVLQGGDELLSGDSRCSDDRDLPLVLARHLDSVPSALDDGVPGMVVTDLPVVNLASVRRRHDRRRVSAGAAHLR
jgi:hypothetical protein